MAKWEIKSLFRLPSGRYLPCGLNIIDQLWWRFVPGVVINVKWPNGPVIKEFMDQYRSDRELLSADPNDHYRPWMEQHVGRQGWDWNWGMAGNDVSENRLTIKIRRKYQDCAIIAKLQWS